MIAKALTALLIMYCKENLLLADIESLHGGEISFLCDSLHELLTFKDTLQSNSHPIFSLSLQNNKTQIKSLFFGTLPYALWSLRVRSRQKEGLLAANLTQHAPL